MLDGPLVHLHGVDAVGVEDELQLLADGVKEEVDTVELDAAGRGAYHAALEREVDEQHNGEERPEGCVGGGEPRGAGKRYHLKGGVAERITQVVPRFMEQLKGDEQDAGGDQDHVHPAGS